jgi:hypothetical protein
MTVIACSQCGKEFEDDVLCCPHCGAAQIPQLSKAQLRLEHMKASRGPLAATYIGMGLGLVAGGVYFTITALANRASFASGLAILMGGMVGSAAGFLVHYSFLRDRRS